MKWIANPKILILMLVGISFLLASCGPRQLKQATTSELDSINAINSIFGANCSDNQIFAGPPLITKITGWFSPQSGAQFQFQLQSDSSILNVYFAPFYPNQQNRGMAVENSNYMLNAQCTDDGCQEIAIQIINADPNIMGLPIHEEIMLQHMNGFFYGPIYSCEGSVSSF